MRLAHLLAGALALWASTSAVGQNSEQSAEVRHRNDCRLAAQVLQTGHPANRAGWAVEMIGTCAKEGPAVLVQLWSQPALDSTTAGQLLNAGSRIRDERIARAALEVARNASHRETVRVMAIALLIFYADPYSRLSIPGLVPPPGWVPGQHVRMVSGGTSPHKIPQQNGEAPLSSEFVARTAAALRALGSSDPSPRIQYVATGLARRLEHQAASHAGH